MKFCMKSQGFSNPVDGYCHRMTSKRKPGTAQPHFANLFSTCLCSDYTLCAGGTLLLPPFSVFVHIGLLSEKDCMQRGESSHHLIKSITNDIFKLFSQGAIHTVCVQFYVCTYAHTNTAQLLHKIPKQAQTKSAK